MPLGGLHLGREGLEQETSAESFPSDSLFAALIALAAQVYGAQGAAELLAAFEDSAAVSTVFGVSACRRPAAAAAPIRAGASPRSWR